MFNFLKVLLAVCLVIVSAYLFARFSQSSGKSNRRYFPSREEVAAKIVERKKNEAELGRNDSGPIEDEDRISRFLAESDGEKRHFLFKEQLQGLDIGELGAVFEAAMLASGGQEDAIDAAKISLQEIARVDPFLALNLLYGQESYRKEDLAKGIASGWSESDPLSAWDWIESAWMDQGGTFMDRALQNELSVVAMDIVLDEHEDLPMAATLASLTNQPDLKNDLVRAIAAHVVSEDPEAALARFEFEGDSSVDVAIMDAVIGQWAERDLEGATTWVLENENEISSEGLKNLAKQTVLSSTPEAINEMRSQILSSDNQDVFVAEAARVLVRQNLVESAQWIGSIQNSEVKDVATREALYELGFEDFDSSLVLLDLAYDREGGVRLEMMSDFLENWNEQDGERVRRYLESGQALSVDFATQLKEEFGYE